MGHFAVIFACFLGLSWLAAMVNFGSMASDGPDEKHVKRHLVCMGVAGISWIGLMVFGIGWVIGKVT